MNLEFSFLECSWGKVHYKEINKDLRKTVLCLHGWMDNWSSFLPISTELNGRLIAIDLPGHGLSEHIQDGNWYHFIDYIVRLKEIVSKLNLKNFHIIGHSMGAGIGSLFAGTFPEQILSLIMIDGLGPLVNPPTDARDILRDSILKQENKKLRKRSFEDITLAIKARMSAGDLSFESAKVLVENQMIKNESGWRWTYDYKLKYTSSLRLTPEQLESFFIKIKCPAFIIAASKGYILKSPYWNKRLLIENLSECELDGGHHLHMDKPKETAHVINKFYANLS